MQAVQGQHLVPSFSHRSGLLSKGKCSTDKALTHYYLQLISIVSPVDTFCSDIAVDPANFFNNNVRGKYRADGWNIRIFEFRIGGVGEWFEKI